MRAFRVIVLRPLVFSLSLFVVTFLLPQTPTQARRLFGSCTYVRCDSKPSACLKKLAECHKKVLILIREISDLRESLATCVERRRCLKALLKEAGKDRDRILEKLRSVRHKLTIARIKLATAEEQLAAVQKQLALVEQELKYVKEELAKSKERLVEGELENKSIREALDRANSLLAACESTKLSLQTDLSYATRSIQEMEVRLARWSLWTWILAAVALLLLLLLLIALLQMALARHRREQDQDQIKEFSNRYSMARSRVIAYRRQIEELLNSNGQLHRVNDECKSDRLHAERRAAIADERLIGTTRELASKKECCSCKASPSVVYGPGPVFGDKTHAGTTSTHGGHGGNVPFNFREWPSSVCEAEVPENNESCETRPRRRREGQWTFHIGPNDCECDSSMSDACPAEICDEGLSQDFPAEGAMDEKQIKQGDTLVYGMVKVTRAGGRFALGIEAKLTQGGIVGPNVGVVELVVIDRHCQVHSPTVVQVSTESGHSSLVTENDESREAASSATITTRRAAALCWCIAAKEEVELPLTFSELRKFVKTEFGVHRDIVEVLEELAVGEIASLGDLSFIKLSAFHVDSAS